MKSMYKHWGLHISTNINCLGAVLGSFWVVWKGLLWCLKVKLRSWRFPRYWRFNKRYHGGYQLICLISRPLLIASRRDWYRSKGFLKGFKLVLRPWESSKNWWRYDQMKFVILTHLIRAGWLKKCHTSILAFNITQFFPSLNHQFLSICLKKAGLNANVIHFFNSYYSNCSTSYSWNTFTFPSFNVNISVDQGSALSPILSALYLAPIIKTFKKRIKNLNKEFPTDILSFVDNRLLISQKKNYSLSNSFLLCSYNIISKILIDTSLVMEHNKTKLFHFMRARHPPNPSIDLTTVGGSIITPKPIWRYLGFFFDRKLNFYYHTHFYATKCLSTLSTMKMLGNSSRGLLPIQKTTPI